MTAHKNTSAKAVDQTCRKKTDPKILNTIQWDEPTDWDKIITRTAPETPESLRHKALIKDTAKAVGCDAETVEAARYDESQLMGAFNKAIKAKSRRLKMMIASAVFATAAAGVFAVSEEERKAEGTVLLSLAAMAYVLGRAMDTRVLLRGDIQQDAAARLTRRPAKPPKAPPPPPYRP